MGLGCPSCLHTSQGALRLSSQLDLGLQFKVEVDTSNSGVDAMLIAWEIESSFQEAQGPGHWHASVFSIKWTMDSRHRGRGFQYLADWEGYGPEEHSWILRSVVLDKTKL